MRRDKGLLLRIFVHIFLCCFCNSASAAPTISAELSRKAPSRETRTLISIAENVFEKEVESIDYINRDSPPVGDAAAIVSFKPEKKSETTYVFPSALFYYLPWSKNKPLTPKKKQIIRGKWTTDGVLQKREMYQCKLAGGTYYVAFAKDVGFEETMDLLKAIESDDYDIDLDTSNPKLAALLKSIDTKDLRKLSIASIYYVTADSYFEPERSNAKPQITAFVIHPKVHHSMWTFVKMSDRYTLISMAPFVF